MTTPSHLGAMELMELMQLCVDEQARALRLFALLGAAARTAGPGPRQRMLVTACHRHAHHAELWEARLPRIAQVEPPAPRDLVGDLDELTDDEYRRQLDQIESTLTAVAARIDPELDPSTHRLIELVRHDLP